MRRQQRIHAIAIASIVVVTMLAYVVLKPTKVEQVERLSGDRAIEIHEATWGMNCNPSITTAMHETPSPPAKGKPATPPRKLALVQQNNVLMRVGNACNGKLTCGMKADSETLGEEPLQSCFKYLVVRYRCFAYDRAWEVTTKQGETLTVDCHAPATPPSKP